jgi:hypothetical protein
LPVLSARGRRLSYSVVNKAFREIIRHADIAPEGRGDRESTICLIPLQRGFWNNAAPVRRQSPDTPSP